MSIENVSSVSIDSIDSKLVIGFFLISDELIIDSICMHKKKQPCEYLSVAVSSKLMKNLWNFNF